MTEEKKWEIGQAMREVRRMDRVALCSGFVITGLMVYSAFYHALRGRAFWTIWFLCFATWDLHELSEALRWYKKHLRDRKMFIAKVGTDKYLRRRNKHENAENQVDVP